MGGVAADDLAQTIVSRVPGRGAGQGRRLVAIAGPPASGKSTLAAATRDALTAMGLPTGLVPMDGFHLDNHILDARGLRHRKGAPETFDVQGFAHLLGRLKREAEVFVPAFDRALDLTINARVTISEETEIVLVEGNYLLLDAPGWRDLRPLWDLSIRLDVPLETLEARLWARWRAQGLEPDAIAQKVDGNDLANARLVAAKTLPADLTWPTA